MAYSTSNPPALVTSTLSGGPQEWVYTSTDAFSVVSVDGYFTDAFDLGMRAGDLITVIDTDTATRRHLFVTARSLSAETVTISSTLNYELTASGAVAPGVSSIELNHATVVVAATVATSLEHQGLFVIKNTSASGTAAHTLTLTVGTLNGTATVATLNAPNEALAVWFDSAGNGTILENVGSVALS